ncbi:hypothetical protein KKF25_03140, partial [Patescibacteria group bacterium]|nr:hypothetical protein [Patescibacteria group bacterium]
MGEAEKIDTLSEPETQGAGKPEAIGREDIFRQLEALIDRSGFDLRGKIKKSKEIDKPVRDEMLGHIDEALGLITNFRRDGFSEKPAGEAADYFDVLQKMGEEHIPGFEKELTEYNGKIEAENSTPRLVVDNVKGAEKNIQTSPVADAGGREMAAVEKSEDEFKGESPLFSQQAERFNDVKEAGEVDMTKIEKSPVKRDGGKEPPGGENEEKLKKQLDAAYKELYGFLNDKKVAPKEVYDLIRQTENELRGLVRFRGEVADIAEEIKEKYKKDERSEEEKAKKGKKIVEKGKDGAEKEPGKKSGYTKEMIKARAAEIKQRRIENRPGFEWTKIDELLRDNKIEPGTSEASEFLAKWDRNTAESELRREEIKKEREGANNKAEDISEKEDFLKIKPTEKTDIVDETLNRSAAEVERMKEIELARLGAEITLSKITDYKKLWAETEQEGDEKFKEKTRELWKEFAVHGLVGFDEDKKLTFTNGTDLDGQGCL